MKDIQKYLERILTNKMFLYVIVFLTIMTVLGYMMQKQYDSVIFLIAVGIIVKNFNKNMALVLLISVFVTSLYNFVKRSTLEGASGSMRIEDEEEEEGEDDETDQDMMDNYFEDEDVEDEDGFRSKFNTKNEHRKIAEYNKIKDTYNNLIGTIREKTAQIKKMTAKLKRN
jgi:hypothetical protein